jgi:hypothetical protein
MLDQRKEEAMNRRIWFSIALIVALFCFWLVMAKPG